jgi:hypothetical protein
MLNIMRPFGPLSVGCTLNRGQEAETEMPAKLDPVKSVTCFSRTDKSRVPIILRLLGVSSFLAFSSASGSPQSQQEALRGKEAIKVSDVIERGADVVEEVYVARSNSVRKNGLKPRPTLFSQFSS